MAEKRENLWWKWVRDYLRDPQTVFSSMASDDLMRRLFKGLWLGLSIYVLFFVAGPTQVNSWKLWMQDEALAVHTAWGITLASALGFAILRYAYQGTEPIKIATPFWTKPPVEGVERERVVIKIIAPTVMMGTVLVAGLFFFSLVGVWNYYLHEQRTTGGVAVAALEGNTSNVGDAERSLQQFELRAERALATIDAAIAETSAGSPTGRSRLVQRRQETEAAQATERRELQAALREARGQTVEVRATNTDRRPADAALAAAANVDRQLMGSWTDLGRSGIIELLLILGAGLGLVMAPSQLGVPRAQRVSREAPVLKPEEEGAGEELEESEPAPMDFRPPPRRRFTLPTAVEADYLAAVAVGPHAPPQKAAEPQRDPPSPEEPTPTEPAPEQPESQQEPSEGLPADDDPLLAEMEFELEDARNA